ncbi:hypothetical protein TWF192_005033 [Orbilia oligospora]|nr:hypothetical protein TWF192_005033 [Orbilia oligospora]
MKIKNLYIYPVKSLRGCSVPTATLTRHGLKHDRKYMIVRITPSGDSNVDSNNNVNGSTGGKGKYTYESQYVGRVDSLCLFSASILPDYENAEVIRVTYNTPIPSLGTNEKEKQEDNGCDDGGSGNPYIEFPIIADYKTLEKVDLSIHLSDCVGLEELNSGKGEDGKNELVLDVTKMRPNIVLEPSAPNEMTPFEEDYWAELEVSNGKNDDDKKEARRILLTGNCGRCKSLNVDYETGKQLPVHGQMLKRLSDMKRRVDAGYGYSPIFGRYGFIEKGSLEKDVRVGEEVTVTKKNEERTVFYWPGLSTGTKPRN